MMQAFWFQEIGNLIFDKDDQLAVELVTSAANIRAHSFGIPLHSLFEAKGVAGNIVHAVATTNAMIAGLIVIEAVKVLQGDYKNYRWLHSYFTSVQCTFFLVMVVGRVLMAHFSRIETASCLC